MPFGEFFGHLIHHGADLTAETLSDWLTFLVRRGNQSEFVEAIGHEFSFGTTRIIENDTDDMDTRYLYVRYFGLGTSQVSILLGNYGQSCLKCLAVTSV